MKRDYYSESITQFLNTSTDEILGLLTRNSGFAVEPTQRDAWLEEISILRVLFSISTDTSTSSIPFRAWVNASILFFDGLSVVRVGIQDWRAQVPVLCDESGLRLRS